MSSSESRSANTSSSTTVNEDNRVVADNGGISLAKDAQLTFNNEFSDNVRLIAKELIDLTRDAGKSALDISKAAISNNEKLTEQVAQRAAQAEQTQNLGPSKIITDLAPYAVGLVVAIVILVIVMRKKKG